MKHFTILTVAVFAISLGIINWTLQPFSPSGQSTPKEPVSSRPVANITSKKQSPQSAMPRSTKPKEEVQLVSKSQFASTPSWKQDFTQQPNGALSTSSWNIMTGNNNGWGNGEAQTYTNNTDNVRIDSGNLVIDAKKVNGQYTSARINTKGKFDFTYGKIEIVAMLPVGQGVWPALWFWPTDSKYADEPVLKKEQDAAWLNDGEIDLIEGSAWGDNDFTGSAHALGHYPGNSVRTGKVTVSSPDTTYHTYTLQWTPKALDFIVDGKTFKHVENSGLGFRDWPYDQRYHLIMNVAMGGSMSSGLISPSMPLGINDKDLPARMKVASISYFPLSGN